MKFKKGMNVQFTNKLSGSVYEAEVIEVHENKLVTIDEYDTEYNVPFKFWEVKELSC